MPQESLACPQKCHTARTFSVMKFRTSFHGTFRTNCPGESHTGLTRSRCCCCLEGWRCCCSEQCCCWWGRNLNRAIAEPSFSCWHIWRLNLQLLFFVGPLSLRNFPGFCCSVSRGCQNQQFGHFSAKINTDGGSKRLGQIYFIF